MKEGFIELHENLIKSVGFNVSESDKFVHIIDLESQEVEVDKEKIGWYKGDRHEDKRHGIGKHIWPNGS